MKRPPLTQADLEALEAVPPGPPVLLRACQGCIAARPSRDVNGDLVVREPRVCLDGHGYCRLLGRDGLPVEVGERLRQLRGLRPPFARWV